MARLGALGVRWGMAEKVFLARSHALNEIKRTLRQAPGEHHVCLVAGLVPAAVG